MVMAILGLLVTVVLTGSLTQTHLTDTQSQAVADRQLAVSAVQRVAALLAQSGGTYGQNKEKLQVPSASGDGYALVSFDVDDAAPYSCNNNYQVPQGPKIGWTHRTVPPGFVDVVASVVRRGVTKARLEVMYSIPTFEYSLASQGPTVSSGSLIVGGTADPNTIWNSGGYLDLDKLTPTSMLSNSADAAAISLGGTNTVKGSLRAVGGVNVSAQTTVSGGLEMHQSAMPLADIDPAAQDPQITGVPHANIVTSYVQDETLPSGWVRTLNSVTLDKCVFDGTLMFVPGDVTITHGLTGDGAIFSTGKITVNGGVQFAATNLVALVAESDVVVNGLNGPVQGNCLRGFVYSRHGNLSAQDITLLGAGLAHSAGQSSGQLSMSNVAMVALPDGMVVSEVKGRSLFINTPGSGGATSPSGNLTIVTKVLQPKTPQAVVAVTTQAPLPSATKVFAGSGAVTIAGRWINYNIVHSIDSGATWTTGVDDNLSETSQYTAPHANPAWTWFSSTQTADKVGNEIQSLDKPGQIVLSNFDLDYDKLIAMQQRINRVIWCDNPSEANGSSI
jgi:hypothetical protein